jgi:hypothetical protein
VVDNKQEGDMIILIKLLVGDMVLNVIIAYVPQIGINESVKETVLRGVRCVSSVSIFKKTLYRRRSQ